MPNAEITSHKGEDFTERLGEKAKKTLEDATKSIRSQGEDAWEDLIVLMRKHPGKTLGIAVATGLTVGMAIASMGRGRSSARSQMKDLAGTGIDAWDRVKGGFDDALCSLKDAFEDASEKFK